MSGGGSNIVPEAEWSWEENKIFENSLAKFPENSPDRWENIARLLPGKSPFDLFVHYEALVADVAAIEAGLVEIPDYPELEEAGPSRSNRSRCERKKSQPWSIEEHKLFLRGIEMYGDRNWRDISRFLLPQRAPTQVASHAQKFKNRQKAKEEGKDGLRASIHDIATVSECDPRLGGRSNDAATAALARPSPSMNTFDASASFQGGRNDAATAVTGAYAGPSPSMNTFHGAASSQGRGQGFSSFNSQ